MKATPKPEQQLSQVVRLLMLLTAALVLVVVVVLTTLYGPQNQPKEAPALVDEASQAPPPPGSYHRPAVAAPDTATIPHTAAGREIRYGRALVAHTAQYLGPGGSVGRFTNGMNCQNCHLEAGPRGWFSSAQ